MLSHLHPGVELHVASLVLSKHVAEKEFKHFDSVVPQKHPLAAEQAVWVEFMPQSMNIVFTHLFVALSHKQLELVEHSLLDGYMPQLILAEFMQTLFDQTHPGDVKQVA